MPGRLLPLLVVLAALAAGAPAVAATAPAPPAPERVRTAPVPTPSALTSVRFPAFTADGSRLLASATSKGFVGTQLVTFSARGGDLRCVTCGVWRGAEVLKPFAFGDGRRVIVRLGSQTARTPARHGVVECAPSVRDCRRAVVVPIAIPGGGEAGVVQDQRELRIAPDGVHLAFSQARRTASGGVEGLGVVGRLVRRAGRYDVVGARVVASGGELKGWTPDGRAVLVARFHDAFEAANPDVVRIDLRTGRERRVTRAPAWDEDVDLAPRRWRGRGWMVVGSARGSAALGAAAHLPRPAAIDAGLRALPFVVFAGSGAAIAEPWLVDEHDARGGYRGQPLAPGGLASGWDAKPNFRWRPDGTAVVFWQQRRGDAGRARAVIASLPDRRPQRPPRARASVVGAWAPPLAGHVPADRPRPRPRAGRVSGRMTVRFSASRAAGFTDLVEVRYRRFADVRGHVLDGVERSHFRRNGLYGGPARYTADVRLSGRRTGHLRARDVRIGPGLRGTIRVRVGGRVLTLGPLRR